MRLMTMKIIPEEDWNVKYEPSLLPSTGQSLPAWTSRSYMREGEPILSEVAYTVNWNVRMMAKRAHVWI
ncbi:hypothetical protein B8W95_13020 [Staphylococcus pasteuri]|nr:hypothetical protein B8W95_13020 [Staphylococcus pasteuri]